MGLNEDGMWGKSDLSTGGKLDRCTRVSNTFNADHSEPLCCIERGGITE